MKWRLTATWALLRWLIRGLPLANLPFEHVTPSRTRRWLIARTSWTMWRAVYTTKTPMDLERLLRKKVR